MLGMGGGAVESPVINALSGGARQSTLLNIRTFWMAVTMSY